MEEWRNGGPESSGNFPGGSRTSGHLAGTQGYLVFDGSVRKQSTPPFLQKMEEWRNGGMEVRKVLGTFRGVRGHRVISPVPRDTWFLTVVCESNPLLHSSKKWRNGGMEEWRSGKFWELSGGFEDIGSSRRYPGILGF